MLFLKSLSLFAFYLHTVAAETTTLSWNECINETVNNNADIQSALESQRSSRYLLYGSYSNYLPQITATVSLSRGQTLTSFGDKTGSNNLYNGALSGSYNLFNGFQDLGKNRQADANTQIAILNAQITKAKVSYELTSAYENLRYAMASSKLTQEIIRRRDENLRLVDLRFQSGRENKGSVLLAKAYTEQARYDDLQAQTLRRVSSAQLAKSLGRDESVELILTDDIPGEAPPSQRPDFAQLAESTPDVRQSQSKEKSAEAAVTIARSQFLPSLNMTGSIGKLGNNFFPSETDRWSFGVNLTYPLFTGGKDFYTTRSALAAESAAHLNRISSQRDIVAKLEQAYANYLQAVAKFKVDESFKNAAQTRSEIARKRYNNGLLTFEDWDVIENDLINRQKTFLQSRRDRILAEAAWLQALGKGVMP